MRLLSNISTRTLDIVYRVLLSIRYNVSIYANIINPRAVSIGRNTSVSFNSVLWADGNCITIGNNCTIHPYAYLRLYGGRITIGNNVYINPYSILYGHGNLIIGNNVLIAGHSMIIPANHNYQERNRTIIEQGETCQGIIIGNDVWIGSHAVILDGVSIGDGCIIAAGAIVNRSTDPFCVYAGVPAKKIKERCKIWIFIHILTPS